MLYPKEFLRELDKHHNKITYVRIVALTFDERPLETIEGRVTSGSISLDGSSAIRRTCQVSLVTPKINISNYYWGLNTKIKLAVGIENHIDNNYPNIIWFEQGIFIITSFSSSYSASSYTINLTGKDKMCLLNGEISGSLGSSVDFGTIEQEVSKGVWKKVKLPVKTIIKEMVHAYAGEPFHNIIINDLDTVGLTLQEYKFSSPMFLLREKESNVYFQGFINQDQTVTYKGNLKTLKELLADSDFQFEGLLDPLTGIGEGPDIVAWGGKNSCVIAKIDYGETAGYTEGALVYPSDLIANAGESITSVLDKIKNFLGEFEYFYNLQGQFVFQRKKIYVQNTWSPIKENDNGETYVEDLNAENGVSYIFNGSELITAFNNTPNLANLKNDFAVWGENRNKLPIHMRYALDKKPSQYTTIAVLDTELSAYNEKHGLNVKGQNSKTYIAILNTDEKFSDSESECKCDWREIIYRMALDYSKYNHLDDFETRVIRANPDLYTTGRTGYEQYYIDLQGFWRLLYNPFEDLGEMTTNIDNLNNDINKLIADINKLNENIDAANDDIQTAISAGDTAKIEESQSELALLRETLSSKEKEKATKENELNKIENKKNEYYYFDNKGTIMSNSILFGWARAIYDAPENILFWFDFMDTQGELEQFSVPAIGDRAKVENDNQVKAIYYRETPNIIFQTGVEGAGENPGYKYFNVPSAFDMFSKSAQGKSAKEAIDSLLYNYSYCNESVSITSIPIYYLDTNIRIYVSDIEAGIEGEYIVSKISMPLSYNGTMSITATKAAQRLL